MQLSTNVFQRVFSMPAVSAWLLLMAPMSDAAPQSAPSRVRIGASIQQARLIKRVPPVYPEEAKQKRVQGTVVLAVLLDKGGSVQSVQVVSGEQLLVPAATEAVSQWKYKPMVLNGQPVEVESEVKVTFTLREPDRTSELAEKMDEPIQRVKAIYPSQARQAGLEELVTVSVLVGPDGLVKEADAVGIYEETRSLVDAAIVAARQFRFRSREPNGRLPAERRKLVLIEVKPERPWKRITVSEQEQERKLIKSVAPVYLPAFVQSGARGDARLQVLVGANGRVKRVELLSGHPLVANPAVSAVRHWRYQLTVRDGEPVEVLTEVQFHVGPPQ